ncbi:hypothetical protein FA95DRAFT_492084 [Auriscalpium vulgare]|uniref:Uncharacterized protein n=1 Tax=Auriscalpium vulgare TaxID=40419 RepID=A0ACB8S4M9_9AGAM|nr:hypothetical protein FA95DRAFT_492084 [Auriscalpium vulgare]
MQELTRSSGVSDTNGEYSSSPRTRTAVRMQTNLRACSSGPGHVLLVEASGDICPFFTSFTPAGFSAVSPFGCSRCAWVQRVNTSSICMIERRTCPGGDHTSVRAGESSHLHPSSRSPDGYLEGYVSSCLGCRRSTLASRPFALVQRQGSPRDRTGRTFNCSSKQGRRTQRGPRQIVNRSRGWRLRWQRVSGTLVPRKRCTPNVASAFPIHWGVSWNLSRVLVVL